MSNGKQVGGEFVMFSQSKHTAYIRKYALTKACPYSVVFKIKFQTSSERLLCKVHLGRLHLHVNSSNRKQFNLFMNLNQTSKGVSLE